MKIKVSDFIVKYLEKNNINTLFTITGGFAMHLNDSFGLNTSFEIFYQHHEQACGYSAVGYSKANSRPVVVCTTAGVAATNAISPCLVAHQGSLPVLFISGQVKSTESISFLNTDKMKLRHYAGADSDIIAMVTPITKYAKEILNVKDLMEVLHEAIYNLINGRPGPVWLSIPVDIQGMLIDEVDIPVLTKSSDAVKYVTGLEQVYDLLRKAQRPLIIAGNGIKLGNAVEKFNHFIDRYQIPAVVTMLSTDVIETDNDLYAGKIGLIGDRHGNFTLQNSDLIISLGCRMAQGIVGYRSDWFAREAKVIYIDNDQNELEKNNIPYALKLNMDLNVFFDTYNYPIVNYENWNAKCLYWKNKWIFEVPLSMPDDQGINPYFTLKKFYRMAPSNKITMASGGSIVTNVWHMLKVKSNDKFLLSSQGDMGFEIPAAIGAQIAYRDKTVFSILGEGSFQLNIQELQTIVQYKLPIKIFLFNNNAYGAIKITQTNFFKNKFGVDESSGLSFPKTEKVANAYGICYMSCRKNEEVDAVLEKFIAYDGPVILEVFSCIQCRYPRLNAVKNDDGTFTNRPYEDMDPFMDREEFKQEMIVNPV